MTPDLIGGRDPATRNWRSGLKISEEFVRRKRMKAMKIFSLLLLIFSIYLQGTDLDFCHDSDECGKVAIWIVEEATKELVKENFYVFFCDCFITDKESLFLGSYVKFYIRTKERGPIYAKVPVGEYCLQFAPEERDNNLYGVDPVPSLNTEYRQMIKVEKDQLTKVKKIVKPGGILKITLVDKNNNRINPKEIFNNRANISCNLSSENVSPLYLGGHGTDDNLNDGELFVKCLFPAAYDLFFEFENMGYGSQEVKNIQIDRNRVTEVKLLVDKEDHTGIEGKIIDNGGSPIEGAHVAMDSMEDTYFVRDYGETYTDSNGYYKIIGLREQKYELKMYVEIDGKAIQKYFGDILIKSDLLIKKDIVVDVNI